MNENLDALSGILSVGRYIFMIFGFFNSNLNIIITNYQLLPIAVSTTVLYSLSQGTSAYVQHWKYYLAKYNNQVN